MVTSAETGAERPRTLVRPLAVRVSGEITNDYQIADSRLRSGSTESKKLFTLINNLLITENHEVTPSLFRVMSAQGRLIDPRRHAAGFYDEELDRIEADIMPELLETEFTVADIGAIAVNSEKFRVTFQLTDASNKKLDEILEPLHDLPVSLPTPPLSPDPYHSFALELPIEKIKLPLLGKKQSKAEDAIDKLKKHGLGNTIPAGVGLSVAHDYDYRSRKNRLTSK